MASREVVVLSAVRSAIGAFGGALADFDASELAGIVMKESVARSGVDPQLINYITVGNCMPTDGRYAYVSRVASIQAGLPMESVAGAGAEPIVLLFWPARYRDYRPEHPSG